MLNSARRTRLTILTAILAACAQVFIAALPLAEARFGTDAKAHVESAGTRLHHAHNEANCAACISQHLLATSEPGRSVRLFVVVSGHAPASSRAATDSRAELPSTRSRAPPPDAA